MSRKKAVITALITVMLLICTGALVYAETTIVGGTEYTQPPQAEGTILKRGVDVSYAQGQNIDWNKVRDAGYDFAILRIGHTWERDSGGCDGDSTFETNYTNAKAAGLMVGVYYYAQPISDEDAIEEAKFVLDTLNNRELDLPVFYDFEPSNLPNSYNGVPYEIGNRLGTYSMKYNSAKGTFEFDESKRADFTKFANTWLKYIEDNSAYDAGFYANTGVMQTEPKINMSEIENNYKVWVAQYNTSLDYTGDADWWQFSSTGKVDGINGNVDINFWYYIEDNRPSLKNAELRLSQTEYECTGSEIKPAVTVIQNGKILQDETDYKLKYSNNVHGNTAYVIIRGIGDYSGAQLEAFNINHTLEKHSAVAPTCTKAGNNEYYTCSRCNGVFKSDQVTETTIASETINAKGHTTYRKIYPATLTANGKIADECSVCGTLVKTTSTIYRPYTLKLSTTTYTYNGYAKKPSVTVKDKNGNKISSSYYTVTYASGRTKVGKYAVTIKFKGNYSGTKTIYFKINPKATTLKSLSRSKKAFTAKWKKVSGVTGYQIRYSRYSNFKSYKTVTVKGSSSYYKTIKKLYSKKTYYIKIRTYKGSYYSSWSKRYSVKTK